MRSRVALAMLLSAGLLGGFAATTAFTMMPRAMAASAAAAPQPASIAVCDVYAIIERHVESDQFRPARDADQERIKTALSPLETELDTLQRELQTANPQDPAAQAKYQAFQQKRDAYQLRRQELLDQYSELVAKQFGESLQQVSAEARKVATELGYSHVIAQKTGPMTAKDPRQLVEEFLSRPFAVFPNETDITAKVRYATKPPNAAATPGEVAPSTPPATPPASAPGTPAQPTSKP